MTASLKECRASSRGNKSKYLGDRWDFVGERELSIYLI